MINLKLYQRDFSQDKENKHFLREIDNNLCFGKSSNADIKIDDWKVDGIHAIIKRVDEYKFSIVDLGSVYGIKVNNKSIIEKELGNGDIISIGQYEFLIDYFEKAKIDQSLPQVENNINQVTIQSPGHHNNKKDIRLSDHINQKEKMILEVSLFWGNQAIDVQSFHEGEDITIGNDQNASLHLELKDNEKSNRAYTIGQFKNEELILNIPNEIHGIIWIKGFVYALDTLRGQNEQNEKQADHNQLVVNLKSSDQDRAHLEIGELSLNFQFISPSPKLPLQLIPRIDRNLFRILMILMIFIITIISIFSIKKVDQKELTIADIPQELKKIVYDVGLKHAKEKRESAIGKLAEDEGGRARAMEGESSTKKTKKDEKEEKEINVKNTKNNTNIKTNILDSSVVANQENLPQNNNSKVDLDKAFNELPQTSLQVEKGIVSDEEKSGNTISALKTEGLARGRVNYDVGGGGESVGIGSLKGHSVGGGSGGGDRGLLVSKGREIEVKIDEEFVVMKGLDSDVISAIIKRYLPQIQHCYEQGLSYNPKLKGKVLTDFTINGEGLVSNVKILESSLKDSQTEECMMNKIKKWKFPRPKGGGTVGVKYPFLLMSNLGKE